MLNINKVLARIKIPSIKQTSCLTYSRPEVVTEELIIEIRKLNAKSHPFPKGKFGLETRIKKLRLDARKFKKHERAKIEECKNLDKPNKKIYWLSTRKIEEALKLIRLGNNSWENSKLCSTNHPI